MQSLTDNSCTIHKGVWIVDGEEGVPSQPVAFFSVMMNVLPIMHRVWWQEYRHSDRLWETACQRPKYVSLKLTHTLTHTDKMLNDYI